MVVSSLLIVDIPVGPSKRTVGFFGLYSDKANFFIWRDILLSPNDIYLHCLNEICGLFQHRVHQILHNLGTTWNTSLCFEFKEFIPFPVSSSGSFCCKNLGSVRILFVCPSSEPLSLGYSVPAFSPFSI